jgi:histidyl-tRNA synthetase
MDERGVPEHWRYQFIQAIDKSEREQREKTAEKFDEIQRQSFREIAQEKLIEMNFKDEVQAILADPFLRKSERLDTVEAGLRHRGLQDYVKRDYTVVRGLAYYTGVVFEAFDRSGEFRAIAGGGRYDTLLKNLGGVDLPALGFGIGDMVLGEILKAKQWAPQSAQEISYFIVIADEAFRAHAMALVQALRDSGKTVDYPMVPAKVGKQFQSAEERKCTHAIVVDANAASDRFEIKNLATREQKSVGRAELLEGQTPS